MTFHKCDLHSISFLDENAINFCSWCLRMLCYHFQGSAFCGFVHTSPFDTSLFFFSISFLDENAVIFFSWCLRMLCYHFQGSVFLWFRSHKSV